MFLLYSWGSLFGVPIKVPLTLAHMPESRKAAAAGPTTPRVQAASEVNGLSLGLACRSLGRPLGYLIFSLPGPLKYVELQPFGLFLGV